MRNQCSITLLLAAVLVTSAALVAQVPGDIPARNQTGTGGVADLKVEFVGFDGQYRAQYRIDVRLQAAVTEDGRSQSYLVQLIDARPAVIDATDERSRAMIDADPDQRSEHTLILCQAWYQVGPLYLDVTDQESGAVLRSVGPLQVPDHASGLTPYGAVGSGNDRLHLHTEGHALAGTNIFFRVFGVEAGAYGFLGFSPNRTETTLLGGTLRIGPDMIFPVPFQANSDGEVEVEILTEPWMEGMTIYAQALVLTDPDLDEGLLFSNGIKIGMEPHDSE